ncbi:MAG TPA: glycerol-3-phosphate responsive antiterminator [Pseudothermotoga sp.]
MINYFEFPIVPAIREDTSIQKALSCKATSAFLLTGDIMELGQIIQLFHNSGKYVFVHIDLVKGLGKDEAALKFLKIQLRADGVITTKGNLVTFAKKIDLVPIQRIFLLDSQSLVTGIQQAKSHTPDYIEVLPGLLPDLIKQIKDETKIPVITGGLIKTINQVKEALVKGATAVSTSEESLWNISL